MGRWLPVLIAIALGACTLGSEPTVDSNSYPAEFKANIIEQLHGRLEDPTNIRDAFISEPALRPIGPTTRYVACLRFNARDGRGQYIGIREMMAIFHAGRVNQLIAASREACGNAAYQPFPELMKMCREIRCPG